MRVSDVGVIARPRMLDAREGIPSQSHLQCLIPCCCSSRLCCCFCCAVTSGTHECTCDGCNSRPLMGFRYKCTKVGRERTSGEAGGVYSSRQTELAVITGWLTHQPLPLSLFATVALLRSAPVRPFVVFSARTTTSASRASPSSRTACCRTSTS